MASDLKILFVVSELAGIVKTGGLADVASALGRELKKLGHDVRIVMPAYSKALKELATTVQGVGDVRFSSGRKTGFAIHESEFNETPVYLIEHNDYFERDGLYTCQGRGYSDNSERFGFFSKAALELCQQIDFQPDIFHCHDWQTAMLPYFLRVDESLNPFFSNSSSVLTIHNAAFQQRTDAACMDTLGIGWRYFNPACFEDSGWINILKGGLAFADRITTVSPRYASELLTETGSHGLKNSFQRREGDLTGILNGCDYQEWNPETDDLIPARYSADDLSGKEICKRKLQECFQLTADTDIPVYGLVGRLSEQKGFTYLISALRQFLENEVQVIVLGCGDESIACELSALVTEFPEKFRFYDGFDNSLAHQIEAGSDFFLMPSLFEPCGLNQMYSLRYGTLPIVRAVGGLLDSVSGFEDYGKNATGFVFEQPDSIELTDCLQKTLDVYCNKALFGQLILNAMEQRFTWEQSARQYLTVFRSL